MRLTAPKKWLFFISVVLIVFGLIASFNVIPAITGVSNWLSFAGGGLLALGCLLKGL